jgi:PAS domain S-box-containing protein
MDELDPQETLRRREAFFRKVLQGAGDITSVLAADGRRIYVSSGVTKMLGFTEEEARAIAVGASTHPDDQAMVVSTFKRLLATPGATEQLRFRQRHKDGSYRTVDAFVHNACDDPDVGGVIVNTRDVTEQVRLEAQFLQAQKLESVGRLAGGVAHDFNNLLTVILSSAELLQRKPERGLHDECVDEIIAAADRARALTRQLLAFARRDMVRAAPLDLTEQVRSSEKLLRRLVGEEVELVVEREAVWPVVCDMGQVDQVLFNLVVNARDATPRGGRITISTRNVPETSEVSLVVRDTGTGIAPELVPQLFEPFFTTKPTGKGTGLGLATVQSIVKQHGGRVLVDSTQGQGAAFDVRFPRSSVAADAGAAAGPRARLDGHEHVLIVEDDPSVRLLAQRTLSQAGYRVSSAPDADEALRLLADQQLPIALVVTDVVLPSADGLELAQRGRALRPGLRTLLTSGYPVEGIAPTLDFLPKPYTSSVLLERVRAALDQRG